MVSKTALDAIYKEQREFVINDKSVRRDALMELPVDDVSHALIISGIRRCGKSTLMRQRIGKDTDDAFYLNFDTVKLFNFDVEDFELLDELIASTGKHNLYFDEIQTVKGWEIYVRSKLDSDFKVTVTGSNASLLSRELGTKLTGRHITKELFPFSYMEYLRFRELKASSENFGKYLDNGGFPEYLKTGNENMLGELVEDILYRDIAVRYGIRDVNSLKALCFYLAGNFANLASANRLAGLIGVKTAKTVLEFMSYLEDAYLIQRVPKFSWKLRTQMMSAKKIYFIDNALARAVTVPASNNAGRRLENAIFWELRRHYHDIYYFNEGGNECDFIVKDKNVPRMAVQVCYELEHGNRQRELTGLQDAMKSLKLDKGYIVTFDQTDKLRTESGWIDVLPASDFVQMMAK
jgi:uncharacterized protein